MWDKSLVSDSIPIDSLIWAQGNFKLQQLVLAIREDYGRSFS